MEKLSLSQSELSTIITSLAHEDTHAARWVLEEIKRQTGKLPVWVLDRIDNER